MSSEAKPVVALFTDMWPSEAEPHAGAFVAAEVAAMAGRGFRHDVLVPRLRLPRLHRRIWSRNVQGWQHARRSPSPPARLVEYPMYRMPRGTETAARVRGADRVLAAADSHPAFLHGHFLVHVGPAVAFVARRRGLPYVLTAHGTDVRFVVDGGLQQRYRDEALAAAVGADALIVVSRAMVEPLVDRGVDPARVFVIPMGVDQTVFRPRDREAARAELGLPPDVPIALFVGRETLQKGFDIVCDVARRLPEVLFLTAGPIRTQQPLRALGAVPAEQLALAYAAADLLVLPSREEGSPVSVVEALASGRPVVASAVGGVREQIAEGLNGHLVEAGDAGAVASAVTAALATRWDGAALRASSEQWWWTSLAARLDDVYRSIST